MKLFKRSKKIELSDFEVLAEGEPLAIGQIQTRRKVPKEHIDLYYKLDPQVFSIVNRFVIDIGADRWILDGGSDQAREYLQKQLRVVKFKQFLDLALRIIFKYGIVFFELVPNKLKQDIIMLRIIDPKKVDFQKEMGKVVTDKYGKPKAVEIKGEMGETQVVKLGDRIRYIGIFRDDNSIEFISPIEIIAKASWIKLNLEEALGEATYRIGFPIYIAKVGNEDHLPTAEALVSASKKLRDLPKARHVTVPFYIDIDMVKPPDLTKVADLLDYFNKQIFIGMMCPEELLSMRGRRVGALESIVTEWERTITYFQNLIAEQIESEILRPMLEIHGIDPDECPEFRFIPQVPVTKLSRARRLALYMRHGIITYDKGLENRIREEELLPPKSEEETGEESD